ncbi:chaperone modulator CbpM [Nitratidesulfovibrio liaohensis]|uniref:Chaperone modulator CbpM n=1 Tax=Nitratidesulfovibrio liaohensis TaxID=2604158 RepID=A0ABY9R530_9BACT|nr:chaperone modulator CbpM [Nitratidesulfovibrio liaohensis]WMW66138.1 chaperone modulator CbpM [Nitratidesulfovibrio liaohensis]
MYPDDGNEPGYDREHGLAQGGELPTRSEFIAWAEFLQVSGVHPSRLGELIELGWLEPRRTAGEGYLFRRVDVYRTRKLERICADFELNSLGGSIVVDLLDRIDRLERRVRELEAQR